MATSKETGPGSSRRRPSPLHRLASKELQNADGLYSKSLTKAVASIYDYELPGAQAATTREKLVTAARGAKLADLKNLIPADQQDRLAKELEKLAEGYTKYAFDASIDSERKQAMIYHTGFHAYEMARDIEQLIHEALGEQADPFSKLLVALSKAIFAAHDTVQHFDSRANPGANELASFNLFANDINDILGDILGNSEAHDQIRAVLHRVALDVIYQGTTLAKNRFVTIAASEIETNPASELKQDPLSMCLTVMAGICDTQRMVLKHTTDFHDKDIMQQLEACEADRNTVLMEIASLEPDTASATSERNRIIVAQILGQNIRMAAEMKLLGSLDVFRKASWESTEGFRKRTRFYSGAAKINRFLKNETELGAQFFDEHTVNQIFDFIMHSFWGDTASDTPRKFSEIYIADEMSKAYAPEVRQILLKNLKLASSTTDTEDRMLASLTGILDKDFDAWNIHKVAITAFFKQLKGKELSQEEKATYVRDFLLLARYQFGRVAMLHQDQKPTINQSI